LPMQVESSLLFERNHFIRDYPLASTHYFIISLRSPKIQHEGWVVRLHLKIIK